MESPEGAFGPTLFSALRRPLLFFWDRPSLPKAGGQVLIPNLKGKVEVWWDPHGIPHVFASDEHDLFTAQGFLHARERLWQMDMSRRFFSGRMAEVFGAFTVPWRDVSVRFREKNSVDFDYFMRLSGIRRAARQSLQLLPEEHRSRLSAYSEGVNCYIEQNLRCLPWEFRLLRYEPDSWTPEDTLTIGKGLASILSPALWTRLTMMAIAERLSGEPDKFRSLYPSYPETGPAITHALSQASEGLWRFLNGTFCTTDWNPPAYGSNNWVVAPSRSATSRAILCNDPHLRITLPSIWYLMHLKSETTPTRPDGYEVWGASIPGSPCIHLGHNRWLGWGVTAALCDDAELYREKIHRLDSNLYLAGADWLPMESFEERIRIRGKGEITKILRVTRHGPVISDFAAPRDPKEVVSFRWTAHDPSQELSCVYGINSARNWNEFLESLSYQRAPTLNYIYADQEGNIGYSLAGAIPIRPGTPSLLPIEGWREENEWRTYVPFGELPRLYNPPEGVIATANNRIADSTYPYYLSSLFEPPYRITRIRELLSAKEKFSVEDMAAMQGDVISLHSLQLIDSLKADLQEIPEDGSVAKVAADKLLRWDASCSEDSVESAIFHVFHHRLMANLLIPVLGEELFLGYVEIFNQCLAPVDEIIRNSSSPWFATRSRQAVVAQSLREACEELETSLGRDMRHWRWGRIHTLTLDHAFSRAKFLKPILSIGPFPSPGDNVTVNMGFYRHSNPYRHTVGASIRMIIDVGDPPRLRCVLPSGQSGHPFSRHYRDQTSLWRQGQYLSLSWSSEEGGNGPHLTLVPRTATSLGRC